MEKNLTIPLTPELAEWIQKLAHDRKWSEEEVAQQQLDLMRMLTVEKPWFEYAGCIKGLPADLSTREGFGPR